MVELDTIIKTANEVKKILLNCKTIKDVSDLRYLGIEEDEIGCLYIGDDAFELNDAFKQFESNTLIDGLRLEVYRGPDKLQLDYPEVTKCEDNVFFDVIDMSIDDENPIIEGANLKNIEELYTKYKKEHKDEV